MEQMKLSDRILHCLFPPKCPFCARLLEQPQQIICPACQQELPWLVGISARREVEFADGCLSPLAYQGPVPRAVRRYKFSHTRALAPPFGLLMSQCVRDQLPDGVDAVTWAPLSRSRRRKRGFDQAQLLAREAAQALELPLLDTLEKVRDTTAQSSLKDDALRRANALGAYSLRRTSAVEGLRLLLVDDVVTSGATLSECARLLRQAGARQVWCLTLAQARK